MKNKIAIGNLNISLSLDYDSETGDVIVRQLTHEFIKSEQETYKTTRILNTTEVKYSIITLGTSNPVAQVLPLATDITLIFQGKVYNAKTHTITKGRIGVTSFFKEWPLKEGTLIQVSYTPSTKEMLLDVIKLPEEFEDDVSDRTPSLTDEAISYHLQSLLKKELNK